MEMNKNTGYLCFLIATKFLGVTVPKAFEDRFIQDKNVDYELIRSAKELGLKVSAGKVNFKKIEKTTVPVIVKLKDESYLLLINRQKEKWVTLNPLKGVPEIMDEATLLDNLSGWSIILGKRKSSMEDNGGQKF